MIPPPLQNTVGISYQIALFILYYVPDLEPILNLLMPLQKSLVLLFLLFVSNIINFSIRMFLLLFT